MNMNYPQPQPSGFSGSLQYDHQAPYSSNFNPQSPMAHPTFPQSSPDPYQQQAFHQYGSSYSPGTYQSYPHQPHASNYDLHKPYKNSHKPSPYSPSMSPSAYPNTFRPHSPYGDLYNSPWTNEDPYYRSQSPGSLQRYSNDPNSCLYQDEDPYDPDMMGPHQRQPRWRTSTSSLGSWFRWGNKRRCVQWAGDWNASERTKAGPSTFYIMIGALLLSSILSGAI